MAKAAKDGESSRTQSTSLLTGQSEVYKPTTVIDKDEGYLPSTTEWTGPDDGVVAPKTPPEEKKKVIKMADGSLTKQPKATEVDEGYLPDTNEPDDIAGEEEKEGGFIEESSRTSPEPSDVSSSSSGASSIPGLKDRLQKLKDEVGEQLTPAQGHEFQKIIIDVGELEAQNTIVSATKSSSIVDWLRSSGSGSVQDESDKLRYGTTDEEDHTHRPDLKTSQPPIALSDDDIEKAQKWSEKSMNMIVADIYHNNMFGSLKYCQLSFAIISFLMVIEAIGKVWTIDDPDTADCEAAIHVRWFLEAFTDETSRIPSADVLAKIRHSIGHCNFYLEGNTIKMYNRHPTQMKCTMIHTCTVDEFIELSATMRRLFLKWSEISKYLPKESVVVMGIQETGYYMPSQLVC